MDKLKFKVSAELKNILGKDLITSSNIAVLELVKNSYDAHATNVEITFTKDCLIISDNGKGMTLDDLQNKWLFVAYSAKRDGTEDRSYRSSFKRRFAGAKGIGRMSCDRLAKQLSLITRSEESGKTEYLEVNWEAFENGYDKEFDNIEIPHVSTNEIPAFPEGSSTGTILKFTSLRTEWSRDEIISLRKDLEKMVNPFSGADNFQIKIIAPEEKDNDNKITAEFVNQKEIFDTLSSVDKIKASNLKNSIVNGVIVNTIADVLNLKTTKIESKLEGEKIVTTLSDRGVVMYSIEEQNTFKKLQDVSINLFYLNRAAKFNFSLMMGVQPIKYGSVFLFRNGFRVFPYGELGDDSWHLNLRAQQGYNRFLGTRDLFGRVDIETEDNDAFKEVSSRDGGFILTEAFQQLMDYFTIVHRRLERYVVGVLWGEGFLRNDYFRNKQEAIRKRQSLQQAEKDSESAEHVYENIGSKVDYLQLIKGLVNDPSISVNYYNEKLADIVSDASATESIQSDLIEDLKKLAHKTNDANLQARIDDFEKQLEDIRKQKEVAEKKAKQEKTRADKEKTAREKAEKERDAQIQKNKYLSSTRDTSKEVEDLMHTVLISSTELQSLVTTQNILLTDDQIDRDELLDITKELEFNVERIHLLSSLITKADVSLLRESTDIDVFSYAKEFLSFFSRSLHVECKALGGGSFVKKLPVLELSIIFQNIISNARKANADNVLVSFKMEGRTLIIEFSDDGDGVDLLRFTPETIFEVGVTNREGGNGIGLNTIREELRRDMNGNIVFVDNNINGLKGATFRITLL